MGKLICEDARVALAGVQPGSVHTVITSPPYWGLRDYGCREVVFDGEPGCAHQWGSELVVNRGHPGKLSTLVGTQTAQISKGAGHHGAFCQICGAWRGQFGLEPTPEMYVEHTVEFLAAIWRVLRDDGTVWWNLGDSYAGSQKGYSLDGPRAGPKQATNVGSVGLPPVRAHEIGLKPKDLVMIPFRVALAAQAAGWWVRTVVVWSKPNAMPESVADRPTTSHEYVLLLTKSGTSQFWTHRDAIWPASGPARTLIGAGSTSSRRRKSLRLRTTGRTWCSALSAVAPVR